MAGLPLAVQLDGELPLTRGDVIATLTGARVATIEPRYSTPDMLAAEQALIRRAEQGRNAGAGVAAEAAIAEAVTQRPTIRPDQAAMVEQLARSGQRIDAVRGLAGTGKTFALDAAAQAWRHSGLPVAGVALSGKAADVLRDETGLHTSTIAQLLVEDERLDGGALGPGQVLIVDEAGMVGTRTLTRLADMIDRVDGKLVLVGDDHQLSEIDAGGAFRELAERQRGVELTHVTRQRDQRAVGELQALREGRAEDALRSMHQRGNLVLGTTAEHTRELMVRDWLAGHARAADHGPAFMVAKRNDDVRDLNHRARSALLHRGQLGEDAVELGSREYRPGDRVIAGVNDRRIGVRNGTTATIEHIDYHAERLQVRTDRGAQLAVPFDYAAGRTPAGRPQLDYAYAVTVHRAQGDTWARAYYLGREDADRQEAYTALSRPREEARFYATAPDVEIDLPQQPLWNRDRVAEMAPLIRAIERDKRQQMALQTLDAGTVHHAADETLRREADRLRALTRQPAAVAIAALERLEPELALRHSELQTAEERLAQRRDQLAQVRRRDRPSAHQARAGAERAVSHARHRVDTLTEQRAAIIRRTGEPAPWLRTHRDEITRLSAIETELARRDTLRAQLALRAATIDPPAYITEAIGEPPVAPATRATWNRAAQHIERYRQHHARDLAAEVPGLGPTPRDPAARRAWHHHHRHVDELVSRLPGRGPERAPLEIGPER